MKNIYIIFVIQVECSSEIINFVQNPSLPFFEILFHFNKP